MSNFQSFLLRGTTGQESFNYQQPARFQQFYAPYNVFNTQETNFTKKYVLYCKTTLCPMLASHMATGDAAILSVCFYYHTQEDRRRPPFNGDNLAYYADLCEAVVQGKFCPNNDTCNYSHNSYENIFHPSQYKSTLCQNNCGRNTCPFAHSQAELRKPASLFLYTMSATTHSFPQPPPIRSPFATSGSLTSSEPPVFQETVINLDTFKNSPCTNSASHNPKRCPYYHSATDRRRIPVNYTYERCPAYKELGNCIMSENCTKSHNLVEQLYHPDKYRKKLCQYYPDNLSKCDYGNYCGFAHTEQELKIELLHNYKKDEDFYMVCYKTEWCPFNHEHNKSICVYAHNLQDFRRKPVSSFFKYTSELCRNWNPEAFISVYKQGCEFELKCMHSHGWKEHLFHPHFYKTTPCQDIAKCHQGPGCPYFHSEDDRKYPDPQVEYIPRGRLFQGNVEQTYSHGVCSADRRFSENTTSSITGKDLSQTSIQFSGLPQSRTCLASLPEKGNYLGHGSNILPTRANQQRMINSYGPDNTNNPLSRDQFDSLKNMPDEEEKIITSFDKVQVKDVFGQVSKDRISVFGQNILEEKKTKEKSFSKSCPETPEFVPKKYKKSKILNNLHLNDTVEEKTNENTEKLKKLLHSIGLDHLLPLFEKNNYSYLDLLYNTEEKCKEVGITNSSEISKIVDALKSSLGKPLNESPGKQLNVKF